MFDMARGRLQVQLEFEEHASDQVDRDSKSLDWLRLHSILRKAAPTLMIGFEHSVLAFAIEVVYVCGLTPVKFNFCLRLQKISPA